ncbi:DUF2341 domain-containing protein [Candidatus Micrarchaeota archaeon]|nr:DUF2341 domain-containing protein [Candidatus Micrarchaeota archaeon]
MGDERTKMKNRHILGAVLSLIMEHAGPLGRMTSALFLMVFVLLPSLLFAPSYSLNSTSSTLAGTPGVHNLYWQDSAGLSGYIFQFCNGTWNGTGCGGGGASNWADSSCSYKRQLNFSTGFGTQNLTNFPVLVVLSSSRINYSSTSSSDIRFYDSDNSTLLYKETELWNSSGKSYIWVKKLSLNNNTKDYIWAYYNCSNTNSDSKTQVWDSNYTAVYHSNSSSGGTLVDSTNKYNGTQTNTPTATTGQIDGAMNYAVSSQQYYSTSITPGKTFTWEVWANISSYTTYHTMICTSSTNYQLFDQNGSALSIWTPESGMGGVNAGVTGLSAGTSYYFVEVRDGDSITNGYKFYKNGALTSTQYTTGTWSPSNTIMIADRADSLTQAFNGALDEIRISSTNRSASWLNATYLTGMDQLITYGSEQAKGSSGWVNDSWVAFSSGMCSTPYTACWSNVTKVINSTGNAVIAWCVSTNNTLNVSNGTSCSPPFTYLTVAQTPTQLNQSASPSQPQLYGTVVNFICNYSNASNNAPITGATVYVNLNSFNYTATYNATTGNYTYTNSTLPLGSNTWYCIANETGYQSQTGSTQTYTITLSSNTTIVSLSPADGSAVTQRTVKFTYNVTWVAYTPINCSLWDSSSGTFSFALLNSSRLVNASQNNITKTYSRDYDSITWAIQCCDSSGACPMSSQQIVAVHTSNIGISASPPSPQCINSLVYFYCNYTDGNGIPIQNALVNMSFGSKIYSNDPALLLLGYPPVYYNSSLGEYYFYTIIINSQGDYPYNCSASQNGYPYNSTSSTYTIKDLLNSSLSVNSTPATPSVYGTSVYFNGTYTNTSGAQPIILTNALCSLTIPGPITYNNLIFNTTTNSYGVLVDALAPYDNNYVFQCSQTCFQTASYHGYFYMSYSGLPLSPALTFEDPLYSTKTNGTSHKLISAASSNDSFVANISYSMSGSGWVYTMVTKPIKDNPQCNELPPPDSSKILLVKNSTYIADTSPTGCPQVNSSYAGVIFEDDYCGRISNCNLASLPYAYNFTSPIYNSISNASYVLLNGDYHVVQNISKLREFYLNGYYRASNYAPSFLMRLSGQFTQSPYGMESFVKINQFVSPTSAVDYYYFNSSLNPLTVYKIKGMPNCENKAACSQPPPHFYLDNEIAVANSSGTYTHLQIYTGGMSLVTP